MTATIANIRMAAAIGALALAGSANAALFSFASNTADRAWIFTGQGDTVTHATGPTDFVTLHIDDDNGVLPRLDVSTQFNANIELIHQASVPIGGGDFSHNYLAAGSYTFTDIFTNTVILTINFEGVLFTARGGQGSWYTTAALQGDNNGGGSVSVTWSGASIPAYQLAPGTLPGSFAFGLSALNSSGALPYAGQSPGASLGMDMLPSGTWWSEASWTAFTVPAPGTLGLLALGGLAMARRRR